MSGAPPAFIHTTANFTHPKHKGFRVPNQWSARDASELVSTHKAHRIVVHNARLLDPPPTLGTHGFQLARQVAAVDLLDTAAVRREFYPQCRELIKAVTGCAQVRGGSHEYRNGFGGRPRGDPLASRPTPNGSGGGYGQGIHADMCQTIEPVFRRMFSAGGNAGRPSAADRHFESINVWRSTDPDHARPITMMPLALCSMPSVAAADVAYIDGVDTGDVRQYKKVVSQCIVHNPAQRWYYFPRLAPDEVLLFRQYDTRAEAPNMRQVFHTAVADPTTPPGAPMRSTIEVRMQAVYGREEPAATEARHARWMREMSGAYADGRPARWLSGPIENYRPPPTARAGRPAGARL